MTSNKRQLIITDIKSWAITTALMFGPVIIGGFVELLMKQDWGQYSDVALFVLGSLLKLVQKWNQVNKYK